MGTEENITENRVGFLKGTDECTKLIRSIDWNETSLGWPNNWQQSLKTTLSIVLSAKVPTVLFWGPANIQFYNDAYISELSWETGHKAKIGQPASDSHTRNWPCIKPLIDRVKSDGDGLLIEDLNFTFSYSAVVDETDSITGVIITYLDSSSKTGDVSNAEERLRMASDATGIGSWDIDLNCNSITYTPTLMELLGMDRDDRLTLEEINALTHPNDKPITDCALMSALETGYYHCESRIVWLDDSVHWMSSTGKVIYDEYEFPSRLLGTTVDITENKIEQIEKNDFIAIASHELKTPLTSIKAYVQMLKSGRRLDDPDYVINLATRAESQVNRMTKLIYSFLDMSRIESGHVDLQMEPFMLDDLISEVVKDYMIHTSTHALLFSPGIAEKIEGDRSRIGQVIDNLVSNAIKYSPLSKMVEISSMTVGEEAIVSIKDYGIGIDHKHQSKVFERFYRADDQKARNAVGFGIGLYLSADIMKRHNGGIWIESSPGEGTTFHFSLPLSRS